MKTHNKNQTEYYNPGRPRTIPEDGEEIIRRWIFCEIGSRECKKLLGMPEGSHLTDRSWIREYKDKHNIEACRNNVDLIQKKTGNYHHKITGWIRYKGGRTEDLYTV